MAQERFLTIREAAHYLDISEKEIIELSEQGKIPAYKVGGVYLRFKLEQLDKIKHLIYKPESHSKIKITALERIRDFWYFNDFFIFAALLIVVIIYFIVKS